MSARHLVQILLPVFDNAGKPLAHSLFAAVREELTERFGGLTAYTRAPAEGLWKDDDADDGETTRDDVVVYEVMTESIDSGWWREYRGELERRFAQEVIVVRAHEVRLL